MPHHSARTRYIPEFVRIAYLRNPGIFTKELTCMSQSLFSRAVPLFVNAIMCPVSYIRISPESIRTFV